MPQLAAKEQQIAGAAEDRLGLVAAPVTFAGSGRTAGAVAAGDHPGGRKLCVDVVEIELGGADLHGQFEGRIVQQALRQRHRQMVQMQLAADEAGVAAPGGLADHMAVAAQRRFGQLDHLRQIEVGQPERVAVEYALVVIEAALVVPVDGPQGVDGGAHCRDARRIQYPRQQDEALLMQGF